jgi:hypothetical protein
MFDTKQNQTKNKKKEKKEVLSHLPLLENRQRE